MRILRRVLMRFKHEGIVQTVRFLFDAGRPGEQQLLQLAGAPLESSMAPVVASIQSGIQCLRQRRHEGLPETYYRDDTEGGQRCFAAMWDDQLAGVLWVFDERHPSHFLDLRPGEVELGGAHVLPAFRGRGLFQLLIRSACSTLIAEGYTTFYAVVDERNLASRTAFERCGFHCVAGISRPWANLFGRRFRSKDGAALTRAGA